MKTAEYWKNQIPSYEDRETGYIVDTPTIEWIADIQKDAFNAGLTCASEICLKRGKQNLHGAEGCSNEIVELYKL